MWSTLPREGRHFAIRQRAIADAAGVAEVQASRAEAQKGKCALVALPLREK
ncbi:MAG: hypothetical protein IT521_00380 [Burkholderiales bacterium]|nr:hypothetical protein [Burkholderiales bacterium]